MFQNHLKGFIQLIAKLRDEEDAIRIKRVRVENNIVERRKKKYIRMERNVRNFLNSHNGIINNISDLIDLTRILYY